MNTLTSESSLLIHSLGWTLLHSLWQGALIGLCLWIVLKAVSNHTTARARYHLHLSSLLALAGWFVITWIQQWQRLRLLTVVVTETSAEAGVGKTYTIQALPQQQDGLAWLHQWLPGMDKAIPWLVAIYVAGMCLMIFRFGFGLTKLVQVRYRGITQPDQQLLAFVNRLKDQMGITSKVKLAFSSRINMPMMLGMIKPVILLPITTIAHLSPAELEAILLHELAHIKRQDYLVNMAQIFIETVLFFNPFMWWISAGIRREREHCCDDLVIAQTNQPLSYAKALAALEVGRYVSQPFTLAAAGQKQHLFHRIKRITEMKKTPLSYGRLAAALIASGALIFSIAWFTPAFAQQRDDKREEPKKPQIQRIILVDEHGQRKEYDDINKLSSQEKEQLKSALRSNTQHKQTEVTEEEYNDQDERGIALPVPPAPPAPPIASLGTLPPIPPLPPMAPIAPIPPMPPLDVDAIVSNAMAGVDWDEINEETKKAIKEARREAKRALKEVDWDKINREIAKANKEAKRAMDEVDWDAINKEVKDAQREAMKAQKEAMDAMKQVDWEKIREERRAADRQRSNANYAYSSSSSSSSNGDSRTSKASDKVHQGLEALERDGLIDRKGGYKLEGRDGRLSINGEEQSDDINNRYSKYFRHKKIKASGSTNNESISITD